MALTADFGGLVIHSDQSITDMVTFHAALREIEVSAIGMLYPVIHTYKEVPLGGGSIFPALAFINGWTLQFPAGNFEVRGGNLTATINPVAGCYVDRTQSAAYAVTAVGGSGLSQTDIDAVAKEVWDFLKTDATVNGSFGEHVKTLGNSSSNASYYELPVAITRNIGSDQGGILSNLLSHDDNYFSTGEVAGQGLTVTVTFNNSESYVPQSCTVVGYYNGSAGHTVEIQAYNKALSVFETKGVMLSRTTPFSYTIPLEIDNINGTGDIRIKFVHSVGTYNSSHRLHLDFIQVELVDNSSTLLSDISAIKNRTDQLSFTLGRVNANSQMISDSVSTADAIEANIPNLDKSVAEVDASVNAVKSLVIAGL